MLFLAIIFFLLAYLSQSNAISSEAYQQERVYLIPSEQCIKQEILSTLYFYSSFSGLFQIGIPKLARTGLSQGRPTRRDTDPFWSFPPQCTDKLQDVDEELCVYTSADGFCNDISIFTTRTAAKIVSNSPAFRGCPMDDNICWDILESVKLNMKSGNWKTAEIPGKGIGMLAARDLQAGDLVTAYTPTFLAYLESDLSTADRESWWRKAIEQLSRERRDAFMNLTYVYGDPRVRVQDIVKANTFSIEIEGKNHLAIFPETSRLNHACNPNAQYVIHDDLLTHVVRVTRPIAKDEEITIAYTSPMEPISTRHAHLQQGFHFTCTCPRCTSPTSDATLHLINTLQEHLNDWSPTSTGSPAMAEELLQIHRDEGLEGFMDVAFGFAALAYNGVGDTQSATKYAALAKQAVLNKDGRWAPNLRIWNEMLEDIEGHWSFGRRL